MRPRQRRDPSVLKVHPLKNDLFLTFKQGYKVDLNIALDRERDDISVDYASINCITFMVGERGVTKRMLTIEINLSASKMCCRFGELPIESCSAL